MAPNKLAPNTFATGNTLQQGASTLWQGKATTVEEVPTLGLSPVMLPNPITQEVMAGTENVADVQTRGNRLGQMMAKFRMGSRHVEELPIPDGPNNRPRRLIERSDQGNEAALQYVNAMFPDKHMTLLSDEGTSARVFKDGEGKVYKLFTSSDRYEYVEDEAAGATLLGELGLGPKVYGLVDAKRDFRTNTPGNGTKRYFPEVSFRRVDAQGALPLLVTDEVNAGNIMTEMSDEAIINNFEHVVTLALEHQLEFRDVEFVFDRDKGAIQIIDAGGLTKTQDAIPQQEVRNGKLVDIEPVITTPEDRRATTIASTLEHIVGRTFSSDKIRDLLATKTTRELITEELAAARAKQAGREQSAITEAAPLAPIIHELDVDHAPKIPIGEYSRFEDRFKPVREDPNFAALTTPYYSELEEYRVTYNRVRDDLEARKKKLLPTDNFEAYKVDDEINKLHGSYEKACAQVRAQLEQAVRPYLKERLSFFERDETAAYTQPGALRLERDGSIRTAQGKSIGQVRPGLPGLATRNIFYGQIVGPSRTSGWGGNSKGKQNQKTGEHTTTREHILDLATGMLSGNYTGGDEIIIKRDKMAEGDLPRELQGKVPLYKVLEGMHRTVALRLLEGIDATAAYNIIYE